MSTTLQYIFHDCFILSTSTCTCIFDYWKDDFGAQAFLEDIDSSKPLYVIVSHHHKDHFTRDIFTWAARFPHIRYILSKDTAAKVRYLYKENSTYRGSLRVDPSRLVILRPGEEYADDILKLKAFGSTDIGCSYLLHVDGRSIFHAGDLNAWIWKDESTPEEVAQALRSYSDILADIAANSPKIDLAMFPVDARIGTDYWTGAYLFVRSIFVRNFVPMHFALAVDRAQAIRFIDAATDFSAYANPTRGHYLALTSPYQRAILNF